MEKQFLIDRINSGKSINQIAQEICKSPNSVTYWLNKFELKSKFLSFKDKGVKDYGGNRYCARCKENKELIHFYQKRGKEGASTYCKKCTINESKERQRRFKELAIEYKGSKCVICGYNKCNGALQFHHLEPAKKEFTLSKVKSHVFNDKVKKELDKCILVCANCHFEIHGSLV